ncbi:MAG: F0F1 ATP synthase subunit A [Planctomycetota bacterium]|jgi:F0F1-type ATP synthase membrane subunit a
MDITPEAPVNVAGLPFEGYNVATLYNTWLVMAILIVLAWLAVRSMRRVPGRMEVAFEMLTEFFEDLCDSALGKEHGRKYLPFIATLFVFVLLSNVIGSLPNFLWWTAWPGFHCPTQDLNTPLGLALMVLFVVHISAIRVRGFRSWLWGFFEPSFPADRLASRIVGVLSFGLAVLLNYEFISGYAAAYGGWSLAPRLAWGAATAAFACLTVLTTVFSFQLRRVPNMAMAPLNFVGELGKAISHPFRLFGNIFGGFVILTIALQLAFHISLPPVLKGFLGGVGGLINLVGMLFFGLFIGLVQAFVFAMLALAYTAVQIRD